MIIDTDLSISDVVMRVLISFLVGLFIGIEREIHHKAAGLRTSVLICVGSTIFTVGSLGFTLLGPPSDPSRIAAQIVTGIGFLGAGAIIQTRGSVHGLTTAATIWVMAALGLAVGLGSFVLAAIGAVVVVVVLTPLQFVEKAVKGKKTTWQYTIHLNSTGPALSHVVGTIQKSPSVAKQINITREGDEHRLSFNYTDVDDKHAVFMDELSNLEGVLKISSNQGD